MPKPVLAALLGAAAGAGVGIALACDLRYPTERTVLTTAFAEVGSAYRATTASPDSSPVRSAPPVPGS